MALALACSGLSALVVCVVERRDGRAMPMANDRVPVVLSPGRQVTDPDEAEALGLTVEARRMREARTRPSRMTAAAVLVVVSAVEYPVRGQSTDQRARQAGASMGLEESLPYQGIWMVHGKMEHMYCTDEDAVRLEAFVGYARCT